MKKTESPIQVKLKEIPESGFDFNYSRNTNDMKEHLDDIIGNSPYQLSGHITDLGELYEISGKIKTEMKINCCQCAEDMEQALDFEYRELLMITPSLQHSEKEARVNHNSDLNKNQIFCNELTSSVFDLGEFIHEQIVSNEPGRPLCGGDECKNFSSIKKYFVKNNESNSTQKNPFAALKGLKTKDKLQ